MTAMERFSTLVLDFLRDRRGATALEYGFIAVLVSIAAVAALRGIGLALDARYAGILPALQ
jgi:Flp pilus assembly pilin Flp